MPFLTSFLGRVPLLNKTDYRKKGILILTSLREGLADRIAFERLTCPNRGHLLHSPNWPPFVVSKGDIDQHKEGCNSLTPNWVSDGECQTWYHGFLGSRFHPRKANFNKRHVGAFCRY